MDKKHLLVFLFVLICAYDNIKSISACYITNCPWGGKRSIAEHSIFKREHQVGKKSYDSK